MPKLLDSIDSPQDLKKLKPADLPRLAEEIRTLIIQTVASTGGHLSSNLGVVELTLALHYVFDSPRDKLILDVGHQCYTHKILTGRKCLFSRLRTSDGLLGFPCREESEHDVFNTGHASTALSAALGMAVARDKAGRGFNIIALVGDGSLTGGVALEALNQIGHLRPRLIIVLNHNEMSISQNVGAWSKYLSYLVSGQHYLRIKDQAKSFLKAIPRFGQLLIKAGRAMEELIKKTFFPGLVFEELGIRYIGPVQGHNIDALLEAFETARSYDGPVMVHCVTQKGRGYPPARKSPDKFHSAGRFEISTGRMLAKDDPPGYSTVFGRAMVKIGKLEPRVVAITAAMGEGTGLAEFGRRYPERFYDVGIAEQHAVDFAAGLAVSGLKPVVAIYSTFLQRAYDQVYHDVCLMDLPVVFVLDRAGIVPDDGPTHQGINDIAYLRHMPNIIIMAPRDENELQHMLWSALSYGHPAAVRFPKARGRGVKLDENLSVMPVGKAQLLREGRDLFLAFGNMVPTALEAAAELEKKGVSLAVADARFAKPLDEELILGFASPGRTIVTAEEGVLAGGAGGAVRELLDREQRFEVRFRAFGVPLRVYRMGKAEEIRRELELDTEGLVRRVLELYGK
jgi:1-deoxy-D-xylulose-5-phosphate synthase